MAAALEISEASLSFGCDISCVAGVRKISIAVVDPDRANRKLVAGALAGPLAAAAHERTVRHTFSSQPCISG
jgi:hypothetical protein